MQRGQGKTHAQLSADMVQRILDENQQLILAVVENQQVHKPHECAGYLKRLLHKRLRVFCSRTDVFIARLDASQIFLFWFCA